MSFKFYIFFVLMTAFNSTGLIAATYPKLGEPYIRNYTMKDLLIGGPQVWCWVQDKRGMVYVGDMLGVLEFNGREWRRIENSNSSIVRDLTCDSFGRVFVGGSDDFGFLESDKAGKMIYKSIAKAIRERNVQFYDIWRIISTEKGIYFFSNEYVFRYFKNKITIIPVAFRVQDVYYIDKQIYLPTKMGLYSLDGSRLSRVSKKLCFHLTPFRGHELLAVDTLGKLSIFNLTTSEVNPFKSQAQQILARDLPSDLVRINDNRFAVATDAGRILILSNEGEILQIICKENGLMNGLIYRLYVDADENLWACMSTGIAKIDVNFPVQKFSGKHNVNINVLAAHKFNGRNYIGTLDGIYYQTGFDVSAPFTSNRFVRITNAVSECWDFKVINNQLYAICTNGVWIIDGLTIRSIYQIELPQKAHCFNVSPLFPNIIFVGMRGKCEAIVLNESKTPRKIRVVEKYSYEGVSEKIRKITTDKDGNLWLNTQFDGVYYLKFIGGDFKKFNLTLFGTKNKLSDLTDTRTYLVDGKIQIATTEGLFSPVLPQGALNSDKTQFKLSTIFGHKITDDVGMLEKLNDNSYLVVSKSMFIAKTHGGKQSFDTCGFNRLNVAIETLKLGEDSTIYFSSPDGLFNYDMKNHRNFGKSFNIIISKVLINNDSVLFGGSFYKRIEGKYNIVITRQNNELIPTIDYSFNSVKIHFAALFYEDPEAVEFQCQLVGFDREWSSWSQENKAVYTNLPNGEYTFRVRAKNVYGSLSSVTEYRFTIGAPWYKTWWAYTLYILFLISIIYIATILNTHRLKLKQKELERIIDNRTQEIKEQALVLKMTNEKLVEVDKFKQGVTSMIIHDLKNPINAIINMPENDPATQLKRIKQRGWQMLNLVMNILEVYKYEEAEVVLNYENCNLKTVVFEAVQAVSFLAIEKNQSIVINVPEAFRVKIDRDMIERVLVNLIINAIKYSPNNETIIIEVTLMDDNKPESNIKVAVKDNGIGIGFEKKQLVFEKFGQIIARNSGSVKSTGLGLAYCKMVVNAHKGEIDVDSTPGVGSTFWFTLPKSADSVLVSTSIEILNPIQKSSFALSIESKLVLKEQIQKLQETEFYKITEINKILAEIPKTESQEIQQWVSFLTRTVDAGNETLYNEVLNS
jgi:signal transduction histidine kinase